MYLIILQLQLHKHFFLNVFKIVYIETFKNHCTHTKQFILLTLRRCMFYIILCNIEQ